MIIRQDCVKLFKPSIDWLIGWSIVYLIDWLIDWLIDCLIVWFVMWPIHWLFDWLIDWLIGFSNERRFFIQQDGHDPYSVHHISRMHGAVRNSPSRGGNCCDRRDPRSGLSGRKRKTRRPCQYCSGAFHGFFIIIIVIELFEENERSDTFCLITFTVVYVFDVRAESRLDRHHGFPGHSVLCPRHVRANLPERPAGVCGNGVLHPLQACRYETMYRTCRNKHPGQLVF